jgi:hypothetical protein
MTMISRATAAGAGAGYFGAAGGTNDKSLPGCADVCAGLKQGEGYRTLSQKKSAMYGQLLYSQAFRRRV